MSHDFSQHTKLIKSFRGKVHCDNFDEKFTQATNALSSTEQFLLKMELKRLAKPCSRHIDLRGFVDGECKSFSYQGQTHFLDPLAIDVFNAAVTEYGDYTLGVYDAIKNTENNFRVRYEKEQAQEKEKTNVTDKKEQGDSSLTPVIKTQYPLRPYTIGRYQDRKEERMNYVIELELVLPNNLKVLAQSSDLSVQGCKIKLDANHYLKDGDTIEVRFIGLEQSFSFGSVTNFQYQIKNVGLDESKNFIGCVRSHQGEPDSFMVFLSGFIQGNKRRYKINLDNTIAALTSRGFEQYILPVMNELPIFIYEERSDNQDKSKNIIQPRYTLKTKQNEGLSSYWKNEKDESTLHYLIDAERLMRLKEESKQGNHLIVYSFIHENQKMSFFYSADNIQLSDSDNFTQFVNYLCLKESFKVMQLRYQPLNAEHAYSPFTLSGNISVSNQHINADISDHVKMHISELSCIVIATDITQQYIVDSFKALSSEVNTTAVDTSVVKKYGHKRTTSTLPIIDMPLHFKIENNDELFRYITPVAVECQSVQWKGQTITISATEITLELDKPTVLTIGDKVLLTFPILQDKAPSFTLNHLCYEVVEVSDDKTIINFRIVVENHQHGGRVFFKSFIGKMRKKETDDKSKNKTLDQATVAIPGLMSALRNIYSASFNTPTLMVQSHASKFKIEAMVSNSKGVSNDDSSCYSEPLLKALYQLSDNSHHVNGYPFITSLLKNNLIEHHIQQLGKVGFNVITDVLFVAIKAGDNKNNQENMSDVVSIKTERDFDSIKAQGIFIEDAKAQGDFFCIQLKTCTNKNEEKHYLMPELQYINHYAAHKSKQIEQEFSSVVGVVQVYDVTQETLLRHGASR